jgi:peptide/nickel transport system permease protein
VIPFGTPQQKARFRAETGLNRPFFSQYGTWLGNLVQGDLGKDYQSNTEVSDKVAAALPVSIQLMLYAQILALLVAVPLGVFTAYRANTKADRTINTGAFALLALPSFVLALLLAYWVGVKWQPHIPWLGQIPVTGYEPGWLEAAFGQPTGNLGHHFGSMLLPAISLAAGLVAVYMRLLRSDMIATLQENYITMARAKGLSDRRILWRHAFRPSSLTLLTVAGLNFGTLIGGAVAVEVIFQLPGIGTLIYQAINARQIVELQSYIAIIAIGYVLLNFAIDALYVVLDPRIRRARA